MTRPAGPSGAGCGSPALNGAGDTGGRGSPVRLALSAAEISQPSLPQKLATGLLVKETASVNVGLLSLRSGLGTHAVGSNGSQDADRANPELFFHFAGPQLLLVKKRRLGQQNLFRQ